MLGGVAEARVGRRDGTGGVEGEEKGRGDGGAGDRASHLHRIPFGYVLIEDMLPEQFRNLMGTLWLQKRVRQPRRWGKDGCLVGRVRSESLSVGTLTSLTKELT
ncbi:hypothetical protein Pa4123_84200 [Phytohabitans aurantiacus]|uniref:Uncharacterized protein n=1 Tax=Phytohabitans aurantiacus TaxID=3016789 RepID=A0ABQ5RAH3_9ACTN|nr:hypothetical protein Pa4123_84200 [Phytohabitans aurantiacus]